MEYNIKLNANHAHVVNSGIALKKGDKGIVFNIEVDGIDVAYATLMRICFKRSNGTSVEYDASRINTFFSYTIQGNELAVIGKVVVDVKYYFGDTGRVSSASFSLDCLADTLDGFNGSADNYSEPLDKAIKETREIANETKKTVNGFGDFVNTKKDEIYDLTDREKTRLENSADELIENMRREGDNYSQIMMDYAASASASANTSRTQADRSSSEANRAKDEADRAKSEADRAAGIVHVDVATNSVPGLVKPGFGMVVKSDGALNALGVAELQKLGWTVPNESPIQNEFVNGVLTQKVGRVDLGSLNWVYDGAWKSYIGLSLIKLLTLNMYHSIYVSTIASVSQMPTNSVKMADSGNLYVNNGSTSSKPSGYLYYELATPIQHSITNDVGIDGYADDIQFLGWSVPRECPIRNYKDSNGNFHKRVGKVDLSLIEWSIGTTSSGVQGYYTKTAIPNIKIPANDNTLANIFLSGFVPKTRNAQWSGGLGDASINKVGSLCVNATTPPSNYLYYELATEEIIPCGSESNNAIVSDEWNSSTAYTVGQYVIYQNKLYKCKANNTNQAPTNATYWESTSIGKELTALWNEIK